MLGEVAVEVCREGGVSLRGCWASLMGGRRTGLLGELAVDITRIDIALQVSSRYR